MKLWPYGTYYTKCILLVLWNTCHNILEASVLIVLVLNPFGHRKVEKMNNRTQFKTDVIVTIIKLTAGIQN